MNPHKVGSPFFDHPNESFPLQGPCIADGDRGCANSEAKFDKLRGETWGNR